MGAVFCGGGRLVCSGISDAELAGLVLEDGVSIDDGRSGGDFRVDVIRGNPAMHVDGGDSIFVFGTNSLVRVNGSGVLDVLVVGGGGGSAMYGSAASSYYIAAGGAGGGGRGGSSFYVNPTVTIKPGENGKDGLGGGGGGGGAYTTDGAAAGRGGSGIVIVRYPCKPKGLILVFY